MEHFTGKPEIARLAHPPDIQRIAVTVPVVAVYRVSVPLLARLGKRLGGTSA